MKFYIFFGHLLWSSNVGYYIQTAVNQWRLWDFGRIKSGPFKSALINDEPSFMAGSASWDLYQVHVTNKQNIQSAPTVPGRFDKKYWSVCWEISINIWPKAKFCLTKKHSFIYSGHKISRLPNGNNIHRVKKGHQTVCDISQWRYMYTHVLWRNSGTWLHHYHIPSPTQEDQTRKWPSMKNGLPKTRRWHLSFQHHDEGQEDASDEWLYDICSSSSSSCLNWYFPEQCPSNPSKR